MACQRALPAFLVLASLSSASSALAAAPVRVVALRQFASQAHTRVVVELSAAATPSLTVVPRPADGPPRRLYLDLPGVGVAPGVAKSIDMAVGPLAAVRVGMLDARTTRLVVVSREVEGYELSRLSGPPRVVLDVRAASRRTDRRGAGEPQPSVGRESGGAQAAGTVLRKGQAAAPPPPASAGLRSEASPEMPGGSPAAAPKRKGAASAQTPGATAHGSSQISTLTVVIDPGHGGKDPGARGVGGLLEKTVVLAIARRVATGLRQELGAKVVLTRDRDVFVPLEARTAMANAARADVFISIHANASTDTQLAGLETYYLQNTNDRATIRLAAMENGLTLIRDRAGSGGADLSYILSDLVQQGKLGDSIALSRALHRGVIGRLGRTSAGVVDLGVKQGPFYVLVGAYMPCALVEVAFLTNPAEGRRLHTAAYRDAIAEGLVEGVRRYVAGLRRSQTL